MGAGVTWPQVGHPSSGQPFRPGARPGPSGVPERDPGGSYQGVAPIGKARWGQGGERKTGNSEQAGTAGRGESQLRAGPGAEGEARSSWVSSPACGQIIHRNLCEVIWGFPFFHTCLGCSGQAEGGEGVKGPPDKGSHHSLTWAASLSLSTPGSDPFLQEALLPSSLFSV